MSNETQVQSPPTQQSILSDAIARNGAVVLSLPSAGMLRHHKSRFLAECAEGVWIESAAADRALIDELIARKQPAAISFKCGTGKAAFSASIQRREASYQVNNSLTVEALLITHPGDVKAVQRRNDYRVRVSEDSGLTARVWRIADAADLQHVPVAAQQLQVSLRDISLGGMGVVLTKTDEPLKLLPDERLRIEFISEEHSLILEGRTRYLPQPGAESGRIGVQFKMLENDINGRQTLATLTRIVGLLQRDEVRRMRLGLATA